MHYLQWSAWNLLGLHAVDEESSLKTHCEIEDEAHWVETTMERTMINEQT